MTPDMRECSRCGRNRSVRFFAGTRGTVCQTCRSQTRRGIDREKHLTETYGITREEYQRMLEAQEGRCAICRGRRMVNLDVDHNHAWERQLLDAGLDPLEARRRSIRGLLCKRCNRRLLPAATDSTDILLLAIRYLTEDVWGIKKVLHIRWPTDSQLISGTAADFAGSISSAPASLRHGFLPPDAE